MLEFIPYIALTGAALLVAYVFWDWFTTRNDEQPDGDHDETADSSVRGVLAGPVPVSSRLPMMEAPDAPTADEPTVIEVSKDATTDESETVEAAIETAVIEYESKIKRKETAVVPPAMDTPTEHEPEPIEDEPQAPVLEIIKKVSDTERCAAVPAIRAALDKDSRKADNIASEQNSEDASGALPVSQASNLLEASDTLRVPTVEEEVSSEVVYSDTVQTRDPSVRVFDTSVAGSDRITSTP